jgi:hypothetical protein
MTLHRIAAALAALALAGVAHASLTTYTNESLFQSAGTISFNSNFDDMPGYQSFPFSYPSGFSFYQPFTRGDVTYQSTNNLVWANGSGYTNTRPLIGNNYWTPIDGTLNTAPQYNMFGFEIGTSTDSTITFHINTNLGTYTFGGQTIVRSNDHFVGNTFVPGSLEFRGWVAGSGEYITGFQVVADGGGGNLPGLTEVQVGHSGAQSAPDSGSTLGLFGVALAGMLYFRRKQA